MIFVMAGGSGKSQQQTLLEKRSGIHKLDKASKVYKSFKSLQLT
jgi:hypothetical protein